MDSLPQERSAVDGLPRGGGPPDCEVELPGMRPVDAANDKRMSMLARTIEREIIPRLMLAHRASAAALSQGSLPGTDISPSEVERFAKLVLSDDEDAAYAAVQGWRALNVPVEKIYLDLLAPTARYLGKLWEDDLCNFTDVTVGLGRLQRVLRELSPSLGRSVEPTSAARRILLTPAPGEQHTFGLLMVAEFFRRAGWDVTGGAWSPGLEASTLVSVEWFDVIGFSLGSEVHLEALARSIAAARHAACNPQISVLVGGPLFGLHPEFVDVVGADGMTIDGREAPSLAQTLIARHHRLDGPIG